MPDPAEDVPADAPTGQGDGRFDLRTLGLGVPWTTRVRAVVELADEFDGTVEAVEVARAMIADVHSVPAVGTGTIEDVKLPESEVGILWPEMGHDGDSLASRGVLVSFSKPGERIRERLTDFSLPVLPLKLWLFR